MSALERCRYLVVKYAHDPLRHEPINVGVALWRVEDPSSVSWRFDSVLKRVERLYPTANTRAVKVALAAFKDAVEQDTAVLTQGYGGSGTIIVTEPRAVRCNDMDVEIADLFDTFVTEAEGDDEEPREVHRSYKFIKGRMNDHFRDLGLFNSLAKQELRIVHCKSGVKHAFDFAYKNGVTHRIAAVSFDYGTSVERITRARSFANLVEDVLNGPDGSNTVVEAVVQAPTETLEPEVYAQAKKILDGVSVLQTEVFNDLDLKSFCEETGRRFGSAHSSP